MISEETNHPFQPGVEVALVTYPRWGGYPTFTRATVAKVRKDGRFILDNGPQQYRPYHNTFYIDKWEGKPTGDNIYAATVEIITQKLLDEVNAGKRKRAFQNAVEKLSRLRDKDVTAEQLAIVEAIVAQLYDKKEPE